MRIAVTGANGFIGRNILTSLLESGYCVVAVLRRAVPDIDLRIEQQVVSDFSRPSVVKEALKGHDVVIHAAARAHIMNDQSTDPLTEFRKINTAVTLNLASQAAAVGVKRFIFISSIKVNGEMTEPREAFTPEDKFVPSDPYGLSKYEAEKGLLALAQVTDMDVVIIRPPLVYGPGVKANFANMLKWLGKGIPLPFGAVHNQRSLISLDNLIDFIITCIDHPKAANQIFLVSDGEDVSTTDLLKKTATAMGKKPCLLPVPVGIMRFVAKLMGKENFSERLFGSLQVDISKARTLLDWVPPISLDEGLRRAVLAQKYIE